MLPWKNPGADVRRDYALHAQIGLVAALGVVAGAFTIPLGGGDTFEFTAAEQEVVLVEEVERTQQFEQPPPPPPAPPPPVEVPDTEVIEQEIVIPEVRLDLEAAPLAPPPPAPPPPPTPAAAPPPPPPEPEDEPEPEVFVVVEEMPVLIGGVEAIQPVYPPMELAAGIEGRVIVQFVVNEDGSVTDVTVARGVSPGMDQAAMEAVGRVRFTPGRQRGRPVKVRFSVPVTFRIRD